MTPKRTTATTVAIIGLALTGLAVTAIPAHASSTAGKPVVKTRSTSLGTFLVDSQGRTLYLFEKDRKNSSRCAGTCAEVWPPDLVSGHLGAAGKAHSTLLGTIRRSDGTRQLSYDGHPVYTYEGDTHPGATTGQDLKSFGADWYVVSPAGAKVDRHGHDDG